MVRAYSRSKLAMMITTFARAERLRGGGVVAHVVHPGAVATDLVRESGAIGIAWRLMAPLLRSEEQGADTPLHVALAPDWATVTGAYVKDREPCGQIRAHSIPCWRQGSMLRRGP
jgi:NAD(P)-dependent dehydrogenase (short-subunit alcohol dehydrogenase family)